MSPVPKSAADEGRLPHQNSDAQQDWKRAANPDHDDLKGAGVRVHGIFLNR